MTTPDFTRATRPLRVGECFAGAGGMARGFHVAGWDTAWLCEIDPWLQDVLRTRFPDAGVYGDVRQVDGAALTRAHGPIDLLAQGSPCQDLSVAGKRRGLKGSRSSLFHEGVRVWQESGAPLMLWENVDGARSSHQGKDFGRVLSTVVGAPVAVPRHPARSVTRAGVTRASATSRARKPWPRAGVVRGPAGVAAWRVLDAQYVPGASAAHLGGRAVPQRRTRVFVLVTRDPRFDVATILHELDLRALDALGGAGADGGPALSPVAGSVRGDPDARGAAREDDPAGALGGAAGAGDHPGVIPFDTAQLTHPENRSTFAPGDPCPSLAATGKMHVAVSFKPSHFTREKDGAPSVVAHPLAHDADKGDQDPVVLAFYPNMGKNARTDGITHDLCPTISGGEGGNNISVLAWGSPLRAAGEPEVADPLTINEQSTWTHEGTTFRLHNVVQPTGARGVVRRLTPVECCRLMAWPDWWLDVPVGGPAGKPASDSRKYRATGNGVASTVSEWIARRIDLHYPD